MSNFFIKTLDVQVFDKNVWMRSFHVNVNFFLGGAGEALDRHMSYISFVDESGSLQSIGRRLNPFRDGGDEQVDEA